MLPKIILLGREEKNFNFVQTSLNNFGYRFHFINLEDLATATPRILDARLIILDTLPYPENLFGQFHPLQQNSQLSHIPVLALVKEFPPRLRYRMVNMGINDYLTVPFDRLDLQVRVRNILKPNGKPALQKNGGVPEPDNDAVHALDSLKSLYQELNKSVFNIGKDTFLDEVLESLRELSKAHFAMLFEVVDEENIALANVQPRELLETGCQLHITGIPILLKAVRLGEPTFLNMLSPDNPFIMLLTSFFNIKVKSCIVFPIQLNNKTQSLLCLLKSDNEKLSQYHYLLVQNFAHFIIHAHHLRSLRKQVKGHLDNQIWQFYFDFLEQVINQLSFGIMVISQDQRINFLNENAAQLLSLRPKEVLYRPLSEVLDDSVVESIMNSLRDGETSRERPEFEFEDITGKKTLIGYSIKEFTDRINQEQGYIISLKDITYTREIQEEMRRVDRLASLGVMASGIAHEIRNPLAGIKAMVQTFEDELTEDDPKKEYLHRIVRLVNRLDKLLRTLFSYAKPSKPNRQSCNIKGLLGDVISLLRQKIKEKNINLSEYIHPQIFPAFVDSSQIQQVLVNLILNSVESIEKDGEIAISIHPYRPAEDRDIADKVSFLAPVNSENYIQIRIRDNGCGISPDNLKHIFNPFFTTKPYGTGLGLSIVYQIVKENDGLIHYESEEGRGTTCYLYLPIKEASE